VIAIAAGIIEGVGLGHNPAAALITRGLTEVTRVACACGARHNVEMPITSQVHLILEGIISPEKAIRDLMDRTLKPE
jgi:glycerol-3-phosphate dehydrogenase (NAD(P)+)